LESIRVFRNSFLNLAGENDRVIMATSTAPGEGKTTAIVNLALSLSEAGRKVLLVDADMRNPSVALTLRLDADKLKPAGNDVYYRISELEGYGVSYLGFSDNKNLYWKIINVDYLKSVFDELRESYDFILVDTPPCGLVSDTLVIAEACDALLYVILQDTVRVNRIRDGIDSLSHTDIHILGAVMNGAQSGFAGYGENYGYGYGSYGHYKTYTRYGYGYGYGYGYDYGGKKSGRHRVFSGKSEKQKKKSS
ncbi:MAG: CpsD/CapB family tyrosine-protein kinase, partial [Clostridia bacterium]|nr:CpsD/CapB family tyrosine-protein kinase [Clostridia bacterium]